MSQSYSVWTLKCFFVKDTKQNCCTHLFWESEIKSFIFRCKKFISVLKFFQSNEPKTKKSQNHSFALWTQISFKTLENLKKDKRLAWKNNEFIFAWKKVDKQNMEPFVFEKSNKEFFLGKVVIFWVLFSGKQSLFNIAICFWTIIKSWRKKEAMLHIFYIFIHWFLPKNFCELKNKQTSLWLSKRKEKSYQNLSGQLRTHLKNSVVSFGSKVNAKLLLQNREKII